jgi:hypothetical protein
MGAAFVIGLLALVENVSALSVFIGGLATALFVIVITGREASSWQRDLVEAMTIPFRGPFQMAGDLIRTLRHTKLTPDWQGSLVAWIVPLSVFAVFVALFSSANPLIENRLSRIHLDDPFGSIDIQRSLFWLFIICMIWPLIRRRPRRSPSLRTSAETATPAGKDYLLGVQAMSRSLILFNVLFVLQTGLDLAYLWGGFSLPDGMSHAEYAHRGAYPLIVTALLAAGFVLIAMRPGGPAQNFPADPPAGSAMDRTKHPAGRLLNLPARSVCRRLFADLFAARGLHLDGARCYRPGADPDPDQIEQIKFLAAVGQRNRTDARAIRLLLYQRAVAGGVLQRRALARNQRRRAQSRFAVSGLARPASRTRAQALSRDNARARIRDLPMQVPQQ